MLRFKGVSQNISQVAVGESAISQAKASAVHFKCVEKISAVLSRGGALNAADVRSFYFIFLI